MSYDVIFRVRMLSLTEKFRCLLFLTIDSYPRRRHALYTCSNTLNTWGKPRGFPSLSSCFEGSRHCVNRRVQYDKWQCDEGTEQSHKKCGSQQLVTCEVSSHVFVTWLPMQSNVSPLRHPASYPCVDRDSPCAGGASDFHSVGSCSRHGRIAGCPLK